MNHAADFRRIAREALRGKWKIAVLTGLVALLLGAATWEDPELHVEQGLDAAVVNLELYSQNFTLFSVGQQPQLDVVWTVVMAHLAKAAFVLALVQIVLGSIVAVGYAKFNLDLVDKEELSIKTLFDYFPQWKTMLIAGLLQALYIFLWSLLLVIPGVIATYRYAMTSFILAEDPEMGAGEAIDRSKEMMDGHKWDLFCLHFSFLGWALLCAFTAGIGYLWLTPYVQAATAAFYRDLTMPLACNGNEPTHMIGVMESE